jgi:hypothetical protein
MVGARSRANILDYVMKLDDKPPTNSVVVTHDIALACYESSSSEHHLHTA